MAQTTTGQALDVLAKSIELSDNTAQSWASLWEQTIFDYQNSSLWFSLVLFGLTLAGMSVTYLAVTEGKEILEKQSWSHLFNLLVWPVVVAIFLANNGALLAGSIQLVRAIGIDQIQQVKEIQLADYTLQQALEQISMTNAAREQIEAIYNECTGQQGEALTNCLLENQAAVKQILAEAEEQNGNPLESLRDFATDVFATLSNPTEATSMVTTAIFRNIAIPIIRLILSAMQWAFVNMLEAALLLTATFAPIAMGLSLLPFQGRPILAWLIGFISLLGVQLSYTIIVGLAAIVVVNSNGELMTDIAFLFFLAVFAPLLAVLISSGGGVALYRGVSSNTKRIIDVASVGITKLV